MVRYRFSEFTLSPRRRLLLRAGTEVPLIPRYFDLLVLLIERRHEAVHRREIFDRVWADANVSDSALSQAIRTIRRTLGDDSSEPRFIRTVSRHGYRFVLADVIEEDDDVAAGGGRSEAPTMQETRPEPPAAASPHAAAPVWSLPGRAAFGAGLAGLASGAIGGLILALAPGSAATAAIAPVLAVIGGVCGAIGGAGVGAGLAFAEFRFASSRMAGLVGGAALGGGLVGAAVQWLARLGLGVLLGLDVNVGGALAGVAIGAASGAGYAFAVTRPDQLSLLRAALVTAVFCGLAGLLVTLAGYPLVGGTIHEIANAAEGSRATLAPLGRLIGEPDFGPVSGAIIAFGEAATFGLGLALGLLSSQSHALLTRRSRLP